MESSAIRSHYESHDFLRPHPLSRRARSPSPGLVAEANARVSHWMTTLGSGRGGGGGGGGGRKKMWSSHISRSVSNLSDLKEEDEEEVNRKWVWFVGVVYIYY